MCGFHILGHSGVIHEIDNIAWKIKDDIIADRLSFWTFWRPSSEGEGRVLYGNPHQSPMFHLFNYYSDFLLVFIKPVMNCRYSILNVMDERPFWALTSRFLLFTLSILPKKSYSMLLNSSMISFIFFVLALIAFNIAMNSFYGRRLDCIRFLTLWSFSISDLSGIFSIFKVGSFKWGGSWISIASHSLKQEYP